MSEVVVDFCQKSKEILCLKNKVFKTNTSFLIHEMNQGRGGHLFKLVALFDKYYLKLENSTELKIRNIHSDDMKIFKKLNSLGYVNFKKTKVIFKNNEKLLEKKVRDNFRNISSKEDRIFYQFLVNIDQRIELPLYLINNTTYVTRKKEIRKMIYAFVMNSLPKESGLHKRAKWLGVSRRSLIENAIENNPYLIREKRYVKLGYIPMANPKDKIGIEKTKLKLSKIHRRLKSNNLREGEGSREFTSYAFVKKNNRTREYEILSVMPNAYKINEVLNKDNNKYKNKSFYFQKKKVIELKKVKKKTVYRPACTVQVNLLPEFIESDLLKLGLQINSVSTNTFYRDRYISSIFENENIKLNGLENNTLHSILDLIEQNKSNSIIYNLNNNIRLDMRAA